MFFMNNLRKWPACTFRGFHFLIFRHFPKQSLVHLLFSNPWLFSGVFQIPVSRSQTWALLSSRTSLSGGTTVVVLSNWSHVTQMLTASSPNLPLASKAAVGPHQSGHRHSEEHRPLLAAEVLQEWRRFWRRRSSSPGHGAELPQASAVPQRQRGRASSAWRTGLPGAEYEQCRWGARISPPGGCLGIFRVLLYMPLLCANNLPWCLSQSPQPAGRPWTFTSACFLDLLWVAPTSRSRPWMPPPPTWGWRAASCLSPPPPPPLDLSPRDSPWSKKSRTTFRSMKTITSPPQAVFRPGPRTKVWRRVYCSLWLRVVTLSGQFKGVIFKDGCSSQFSTDHSGFISYCQLWSNTKSNWLWSFK